MADSGIPIEEYRCRICQWATEYPELFRYMMGLATEGKPSGTIYKLLAENMPINQPGVPVPSKRTVWKHFKEHVRNEEAVALALARGTTGLSRPDAPEAVQRALDAIVANKVDDYGEMCQLYEDFTEKCESIYGDLNSLKATDSAGQAHWSQPKIQTYVSVMNTRKAILAEMSKMRQGEKMIGLATHYIMETYTRSLLERLIGEFTAIKEQMRRNNVSKEILMAFEISTTKRLAEIITHEAAEALEQTRKEFHFQ